MHVNLYEEQVIVCILFLSASTAVPYYLNEIKIFNFHQHGNGFIAVQYCRKKEKKDRFGIIVQNSENASNNGELYFDCSLTEQDCRTLLCQFIALK